MRDAVYARATNTSRPGDVYVHTHVHGNARGTLRFIRALSEKSTPSESLGVQRRACVSELLHTHASSI